MGTQTILDKQKPKAYLQNRFVYDMKKIWISLLSNASSILSGIRIIDMTI